MTVHAMQDLCRDTMAYIKTIICPGMSLKDLRRLCEEYMLSHGADSFWYWDVGAFMFSGDETALSVSGREYVTADREILENDIITVDLSPQRDSVWGDFARTIIIESGNVVTDIDNICNREWQNGLQMEEQLHMAMRNFVTPETTFEELYACINREIEALGYVNLDFLGNLGHSIVRNKKERIYIEKGNGAKLSSVYAFTFEPHIALPNSKYGFKHENIYQFGANGDLMVL